MRKTVMLCSALLALSVWAGAASAKKSAAAKEEAPEEPTLSRALAEPVDAADQDLKDAADAVSKSSAKRPAATLRKLQGFKDDLRDQLGKVRAAHVDEDEAGAKDAAIVAVSAALRAVDLAAQGLQDEDDDKLATAKNLGEMASADLNNLRQNGAQAQAGSGGGGGDIKIGPSFGGDVSLAAQQSSTNMSADLSVSFPIGRAVDLGLGGSLSASSSESGSGSSSSTSTGLGYGINTFVRYHFLELFAKAPWIVPYVGFKVGLNSNESFSTQGLTVSDVTTNSTTIGYSLGTLFFVSAKSAITAQVESTTSASSSAGKSSPSTGSITLSMGVRQMF